ncbi:FtsX-like permease family protein [Mucilaginibacter robiniae]|uniref:FtsX-like permease family protein n=1 Tax=Mucilaginibacter robiniae TaxID=2728022 RepID=A0A7L5E564_9SPHI|nr:ABC transporter permease [Mucilaginibacter robiniae]QJD98185.1 FtsX-like permease family protein [Mucilaginibacter robiniae]
MLKNYMKTAWRNLWKGRVFNLMNVTGLSVAVACCILLFLTVAYEFSFDRFHENLDNLYRVYTTTNQADGPKKSASMPVPFAPTLKAEYPEVKYYTRISNGSALTEYQNKNIDEDIHFVDPDFLKMFSFPLVKGNVATVLSGVNNLVISETAAKGIFGQQDPINKTLVLNYDDKPKPFLVTGVVKDMPANSSIHFDILVRFENQPGYQSNIDQWNNRNHQVVVQLNNHVNAEKFANALQPFIHKHFAQDVTNLKRDGAKPDAKGNLVTLGFASFANTHFNTDTGTIDGTPINKTYVISLLAIGCFILVIACINFVNLSVARGFTRAREVGVRKTLGAGKWQLVTQFWVETFLVCLAATMIGVSIAILILPSFKANFKSHITLSMLLQPVQLLVTLLLFFGVTLIAGFYPALLMVRYKTVAVLKGVIAGNKPGKLRNTLLVIQFSLSTLLIICTIITWQQINYLQKKPLGYNNTEVLSVPTGSGVDGAQALNLMRNQLHGRAGILTVSGAYMNFGRGEDGSSVTSILGYDYKGHTVSTNIERVDYDYTQTLGISLKAGRDFSRTFATDSNAVLINERMAKQLGGSTNLIGTRLPMYDKQTPKTIIGIMKDFHFRSLHQAIEPISLTMEKDYPINYIFIKVRPTSLIAAFDEVKQSWHQLYPNSEFRGSWLNENTEREYRNEKRLSGIFVTGAIIAILISCIGLLAISVMIILQRTKEIGIRKVLGASVPGIIMMLSREFVKLVLIAALLAFPIAWWLMHNWLQSFAYRINIHWWVFMLSAIIAVAIAFVTVSFQSFRAALMNPVKSLKTE